MYGIIFGIIYLLGQKAFGIIETRVFGKTLFISLASRGWLNLKQFDRPRNSIQPGIKKKNIDFLFIYF